MGTVGDLGCEEARTIPEREILRAGRCDEEACVRLDIWMEMAVGSLLPLGGGVWLLVSLICASHSFASQRLACTSAPPHGTSSLRCIALAHRLSRTSMSRREAASNY